MPKILEERLSILNSQPKSPGVYQFLNKSGKILYIGKAKNLKDRLTTHLSPPYPIFLEEAATVTGFPCKTESEALILEATLIGRHLPPFNIKIEGDYPYLYFPNPSSTSPKDPASFPKLEIIRNPRNTLDGRLFGPFPSATSLKSLLKLLAPILPTRRCTNQEIRNGTPCLYYHLGHCAGPCAAAITPLGYQKRLDELATFFSGNYSSLRQHLRKDLKEASSTLAFEKAAKIRDQLASLERIFETQDVSKIGRGREAYVGLERTEKHASIILLLVSKGKVIESSPFNLDLPLPLTDSEVLTSFLMQYYVHFPPPNRLYLPKVLEENILLAETLTGRTSHQVTVLTPTRGRPKRLLVQAQLSAKTLYDSTHHREPLTSTLQELQSLLALPTLPRRIEGYDISNTMGTYSVASLVVLKDGRPFPGAYRHFTIRGVPGPDDFASLHEVLYRRFQHPPKNTPTPDLLLIDGGIGQLSAVSKALQELGVSVPAISLAKKEEIIHFRDERDPLILPHTSKVLQLLQELRDEAHRFAITNHRKKRAKGALRSTLDTFPGIGPKRRALIRKEYPTLESLRGATLGNLSTFLPKEIAQKLYTSLHEGDSMSSSAAS